MYDLKPATVNACKLCTPLGASLAFHGLENTVCLLHGSQGCSTYIRRYLISHFKEPLDIASSNFTEESAVYGGASNLKKAILNLKKQYNPQMIGIATTCLAETIGDDVKMFIRELKASPEGKDLPLLVPVSTPSYTGTHMDGFHAVVKGICENLLVPGEALDQINLFSGMISPADIRYLKEILEDFGWEGIVVPDYSETLDGGLWDSYKPIPQGGTPLSRLATLGRSRATLELGQVLARQESAGHLLEDHHKVPLKSLGMPVGIRSTDVFLDTLAEITGRPIPSKHLQERARLADSYADGHKYIFEKRVLVYGEEDFVLALSLFLREVGAIPVLIASGGNSGQLGKLVKELIPDCDDLGIQVKSGADFEDLETLALNLNLDLVIGHSKGYKLTSQLKLPHMRVGFPIHDRFGGQRILHLGYRGTQQLFDLMVNALLERAQASNPVGYTYL